MTLLYGTKHAGYNWQVNHYADCAQPQDAPSLQLMLTTLSLSAWVVLHLTRKTSEVCADPVTLPSLHGS